MRPGRLDLAGGRWVALVCTLRMTGVDLTGAACLLQVRLTPDTPGTPLASLVAVATDAAEGVNIFYAGTASIDAHVAAGRLAAIPAGRLGSDMMTLTLISIRINETTMEAMPPAKSIGEDAVLAWDLHITPVGGLKQKWIGGTFTVEAGVTQ